MKQYYILHEIANQLLKDLQKHNFATNTVVTTLKEIDEMESWVETQLLQQCYTQCWTVLFQQSMLLCSHPQIS